MLFECITGLRPFLPELSPVHWYERVNIRFTVTLLTNRRETAARLPTIKIVIHHQLSRSPIVVEDVKIYKFMLLNY